MNLNGLSLSGTRVLITGGLGFIGSNLAHACLVLGARVTVFDSLDPRSGGNLVNIEKIKDSIVLRFQDILNFDQVSDAVANQDMIFNCAASTSHPFSMREPWIDMDVNSRGTINLLEAVRRFNRNVKFIHLGTSTQLGRLHTVPADEMHPEFPTDIYSANKSASEKYVLIYANTYGINAAVIRLANVYGPRAAIHSPEFTFNNYFIGLALQGRAITVYGDGNQRRNVLYIDDVVSAILAAGASDAVRGEALFAVGDAHYTVAELAAATARIIGGSVTFVPWPAGRRATEIGDAVISNAKIKQLLGWAPTVDLDTGLAKTKEYYATCLQGYLS